LERNFGQIDLIKLINERSGPGPRPCPMAATAPYHESHLGYLHNYINVSSNVNKNLILGVFPLLFSSGKNPSKLAPEKLQ